MKRLTMIGFLSIMLLAFPVMSQAVILDGKTVQVDWLFPNITTQFQSATVTVGPGVEINRFINDYRIDIADSSIFFFDGLGQSWQNPSFNGYRFFDVTGTIADFTAVSINPISNMAGFDISRITFDANNIWVNFSGLTMNPQTVVLLDINAASVPEPATMLLFGTGMACLYGFRRMTS